MHPQTVSLLHNMHLTGSACITLWPSPTTKKEGKEAPWKSTGKELTYNSGSFSLFKILRPLDLKRPLTLGCKNNFDNPNHFTCLYTFLLFYIRSILNPFGTAEVICPFPRKKVEKLVEGWSKQRLRCLWKRAPIWGTYSQITPKTAIILWNTFYLSLNLYKSEYLIWS